MDGCLSVEREVDKLVSKLTNFNQSITRNIMECDYLIEQSKNNYQQDSSKVLQDISKLKTVAQSIANDHKDLHSAISKIGKLVDKNFIAPDENLMNISLVDSEHKQQLTNQVICEYLLKKGQLEAAKTLINETNLPIRREQLNLFNTVCHVIDELRQRRNLQPALQFVEQFNFELSAIGSSLEFYLLKLQFIDLISKNQKIEALNFVMKFAKFTPKHTDEVQKLMGLLLFTPTESGDESGNAEVLHREAQIQAQFSSLFKNDVYEDLIDILVIDLCTLLGFTKLRSGNCHLPTCIEAGCQFLPSLVNLKHVMTQGKVGSLWASKDELPIEINLKLCKYHSLVACPILRQATTDENPAMRLSCGHIISQEALSKISSSHNKMKCPYCPVEQIAKNAVVIKF